MIRPGRSAARLGSAVVLAGLLAGGAALSALGDHGHGRRFSHHYPVNTVSFERAKAVGDAPVAPRSGTMAGGLHLRSFATLAGLLPHGALTEVTPGVWRLTTAVAFVHGAVLDVRGGTLQLAPGTFVESMSGGAVELTGVSVSGVDRAGRPLVRPVADRAFVVARSGGTLLLRRCRISNLGHLGVVAYGISLRRPGPGSAILDSTISGGYFGVYLSHAAGVTIAGNTVLDSEIYGIDPFGYSHDLLIARNTVRRSGLHGIVLADHVRSVRVEGNTVDSTGANGIVLYRYSAGNTVTRNRVSHAFDGIVITDSSRNSLAGNSVDGVKRFGVRISGRSAENELLRTAVFNARLGVYVYDGPSANRLVDSKFGSNYENVRIRADASGNTVRPVPAKSELP